MIHTRPCDLPSIAIAALLASTAAAQVVAGPITNPANGHFYALRAESNWTSAEAQAVAMGGHLATVRNLSESNWIFATFQGFGGTPRSLWIGLNDALTEGSFVWSSGEPVVYTNWQAGEPNNSGGAEDWVHMEPAVCCWPAPGQWNDLGNYTPTYTTPMHGVVEWTVSPASVSAFGNGCLGSAGIPLLTPQPGSLPLLGGSFQLDVSGVPNATPVVVGVLGFSITSNNNSLGVYSLPFEMTSIGMPGCYQLVAADATFTLPAASGQARWTLAIPAMPMLFGFVFHAQVLAPDPGFNALGATTTNAVTGVIGP